jgi:pimeloyl-ACP methyl ester carboxylesterase
MMRVQSILREQFELSRRLVLLVAGFPLLLSGAGRAVSAQQPITLVHGGFSDASTWAATAQRLQHDYYVTITRPNLPSTQTFENQSASLRTQVAGQPANTIAIGHSNGGLVSRQANEDGRSWSGIVTIGTPHTGAPLAESVLNFTVFEEARYIINSVAWPFAYYSTFYPDEWAWRIAGRLGNWAVSLGLVIPAAVANLGFNWSNPVLGELVPGSAYLNQNINAAANLNREAGALTRRVGITSTVETSYGMFFQAVAPDSYRSYANTQYLAGAVFYSVGLYYQEFIDYNDPWWYDKQANAWLWFQAAGAMFNFDQDWCYIIGAYDAYGRCIQNDGVVPTFRMPYPGGTRTVNIVGPAHLQETRDGYAAIAQVLVEQFGVTTPPPPGVLTSVSITGPTLIRPGATCTWWANVGDGTPPYTYHWTNDWMPAGSNSYEYMGRKDPGNTGSSFRVRVAVTDAEGRQGDREITVTENSSARICFQ